MPAPYPHFVYDFTAARGIAMRLDPAVAKALLIHLDEQVSGTCDIATEIVKEIYSMHSYTLSLSGLTEAPLDQAIQCLAPNAARGLFAALTRDKPELGERANELLETVSRLHGIEPMNEDEQRDALLVCSVMYTLPRMTAAVSTVSDHVREKWSELSPLTQNELRSIISVALETGRTGDEVDRRGWVAVLDNADALATVAQPSF